MAREIWLRAWSPFYKHMYEPRPISSGLLKGDELIWSQWTGMDDKNGTPIYEGDLLAVTLVSWLDGKELAREIRPVEFNGDRFGVAWGNHDVFTGLMDFGSSVTKFEVIGNIYERVRPCGK